MKIWKKPSVPKEKNNAAYVWYRDTKMIGTILLLVIVSLQIFAWLQVPVLSTIHGYTIGMLFGYYNPFFYFFVSYFALRMIFGSKVDLPKWLKLNRFTYWFVALSFIFIGTSLFFYQNKTGGWTDIGSAPWQKVFPAWFKSFTSEPAYAPANTNGGVIGAFMYTFMSSIASGIGALITAIVLAVLSVSIIVTGSFIGFYKSLLHKRDKELIENEKKASNDDFFEKQRTREIKVSPASKPVETPQIVDKPKVETPKAKPIEEDDFPFEDPFK